MDSSSHQRRSSSENELISEIFPIGVQKEFVIEAPVEESRTQRRKLNIARFPLGIPKQDRKEKKWHLKQYQQNSETGEPGGWLLGSTPDLWTHKGTPTPVNDVKNLVALKLTAAGTMELYPIDEAFNLRPIVRHKVYTLEEAESLMTAKRKHRLPPTIRKQIDMSDKQSTKTDDAASHDGSPGSERDNSDTDSDTGGHRKQRKSRKTTAFAHKERGGRTPRDSIAVDVLIEEIKPDNVEDWEHIDEADDDDMNMGEEVGVQEDEEMEAELRKLYDGSDASDTEADGKQKGPEKEWATQLIQIIENGPTQYVPPPATSTEETKKPPNNKEPPTAKATDAEATQSSTGPVTIKFNPTELSKSELIRFLRSSGPVSLKLLVNSFSGFTKLQEDHRQFIDIVKSIATLKKDPVSKKKTVTLKSEFQ